MLRPVKRYVHCDQRGHQDHRPKMHATQCATVGLGGVSQHETYCDLPADDKQCDRGDPYSWGVDAAHIAAAHCQPRVDDRCEECKVSKQVVGPHALQIRCH